MEMQDLDGPRNPELSERNLYLVIDIAVLRLAHSAGLTGTRTVSLQQGQVASYFA